MLSELEGHDVCKWLHTFDFANENVWVTHIRDVFFPPVSLNDKLPPQECLWTFWKTDILLFSPHWVQRKGGQRTAAALQCILILKRCCRHDDLQLDWNFFQHPPRVIKKQVESDEFGYTEIHDEFVDSITVLILKRIEKEWAAVFSFSVWI